MVEARRAGRRAINHDVALQPVENFTCRGFADASIALRKPNRSGGHCSLMGQTQTGDQPFDQLFCLLRMQEVFSDLDLSIKPERRPDIRQRARFPDANQHFAQRIAGDFFLAPFFKVDLCRTR